VRFPPQPIPAVRLAVLRVWLPFLPPAPAGTCSAGAYLFVHPNIGAKAATCALKLLFTFTF